MFRFCLVRERPVRSIRKKWSLNNLDKAVALGWGGFSCFVFLLAYFLFIYLNQCLIYSSETVLRNNFTWVVGEYLYSLTEITVKI